MTKFVIVVFDGLRPDMVLPSLMPQLSSVMEQGVSLLSHLALFPSDTRANVASLVTGSTPSIHGFPGNAFFVTDSTIADVVDTRHDSNIDRLLLDPSTAPYRVPTLGEHLDAAGKRFVTLSTCSQGTTRLLQPRRTLSHHLCLSGHDSSVSWPHAFASHVEERYGTSGGKQIPDTRAMTYLVDVFLNDIVRPEPPEGSIIWFNEPDASFHARGVGSPESIDALEAADREFGRVLALVKEQDLQLVVLSDHGHVNVRNKVDLKQWLSDDGLKADSNFESGADIVVVPGYPARISVRDQDTRLVERTLDSLSNAPWCGNLIAQDRLASQGILKASDLGIDGHNAPDIWLTLRSGDGTGKFGWGGWCDVFSPTGAQSMHGGLHAKELSAVGALFGSRFSRNKSISEPTTVADIAPTLLYMLGLNHDPRVNGRVLYEAFAEKTDQPSQDMVQSAELHASRGAYSQTLHYKTVNAQKYIFKGEAGR